MISFNITIIASFTIVYEIRPGTNEDKIIKVLVSNDSYQRQQILSTYKTLFGKVWRDHYFRVVQASPQRAVQLN